MLTKRQRKKTKQRTNDPKTYWQEYNKRNKETIAANARKNLAIKRRKIKIHKSQQYCHICGMSFIDCPEAMDWHHIKPRSNNISLSNLTWNNYNKEIAKCVPLCSCCHNLVHFGNGIGLLGRNDLFGTKHARCK
jgi:hypothetical protein